MFKIAFAGSPSTDTSQCSFLEIFEHNLLWDSVVENYTRTNFTYASDKWLAVAGIATIYMARTGHILVAGLRWGTLLEDLCWRSRLPAGRVPNGAPTWSWLSCKSAVFFSYTQPDDLLVTMISLPEKEMSKNTWHVLHEASDQPGQSMSRKCYPLKLSGHVRSFIYIHQEDGCLNESFSITFSTFSMDAGKLWLDHPLETGTSVRGLAHSFLSNRPLYLRFTMILLVPASQGNDCWQRVGVCRPFANSIRPDSRANRGSFLREFGAVEELTIV